MWDKPLIKFIKYCGSVLLYLIILVSVAGLSFGIGYFPVLFAFRSFTVAYIIGTILSLFTIAFIGLSYLFKDY